MLRKPVKLPDNEKPPERQTSIFKAPAIAGKLATAKAALADLEQDYKAAALDGVLTGNHETLAGMEDAISQARANVARLNIAHAAALDADEQEKRRELAEMHKSQIRACRAHFGARQKAAEAMSAALQEAIKQFRLTVEHSQKAKAAIVVGPWPANHECYVEFHSLKRAVEQELFRLGGDPTIGNRASFPGAAAHDLNSLGNPDLIPPMAEKLSESSDHVLMILSGKAGAEEEQASAK